MEEDILNYASWDTLYVLIKENLKKLFIYFEKGSAKKYKFLRETLTVYFCHTFSRALIYANFKIVSQN